MIDEAWFDSLITVGLRNHHSWLANLPSAIERIANVGYWSGGEPFTLLWILDAHEIIVIEKNAEHIENLRQEIETISLRHRDSLEGRTIRCLCGDISESIPELPEKCFDLVFCEDVLYNLQAQPELLERAISQMIRITRPNGFIVAVEPKFGVDVEWQERDFFGTRMSIPVPLSEPKDMSGLFESKGLEKQTISGEPAFSYCYRRLNSTCDIPEQTSDSR